MSADDSLWYKDAVFYELHVKAFQDSNADGMGDFAGLMQRLDYVQELGVDVVWLLPCYPSPLRDDGYDISDYLGVHADYGTLEDFDGFIAEAHRRGLKVITDLVLNHTSDQHAWFQRARRAPKGSPERDFYVWSDTNERYEDVRIIFVDTEDSNWTWDPIAEQYYWHRFFSHQPDLNWDNPAVMEGMQEAIDFWLDRGLDGFRADAVPYLIERDGTNCENLPETHDVLKRIRAHIDSKYPGRILLAEANQWPDDVRPYFGDGDECHMAFHFPLMPRIFMSIRRGVRQPIVEIIEKTPEIPENCQWCMFLRNHDELTLEMVTDEERDFMYSEYATDPRMRLNLGIRRRLAPLMDNDRRKIELLNSILFTMPGSPIIYYGDELGMGDNIYLGDRDGVRTPMQWSPDRNAGFSQAEAARLYLPTIVDSLYGYQAINVEAQQKSGYSLMNWMRRLIHVRKRHRAFGRGKTTFLQPENPHVLAYLREYEGDTILVVNNLSEAAQSVQLDLSQHEHSTPVELLGETEFLPVGSGPYSLTLGPYGFFWFDLRAPRGRATTGKVEDVLATFDTAAEVVDEVPLDWFRERRWFRDKARVLYRSVLEDRIPLGPTEGGSQWMAMLRVDFEEGDSSRYLLPLASGVEPDRPTLVTLTTERGEARVTNAASDEAVNRALLSIMRERREVETDLGIVRGHAAAALQEVGEAGPMRSITAEQSNTAVVFGDRLFLKLYRQVEPGVNPDIELGRFLTDHPDFVSTPALLGWIEYAGEQGDESAIASLSEFVPNRGDGWAVVTGALERLVDGLPANRPDGGEEAVRHMRERWPDAFSWAEPLGRMTADMHRALASAGDDHPTIQPRPTGSDDVLRWTEALQRRAVTVLDEVGARLDAIPGAFPEEVVGDLAKIVRAQSSLRERMDDLQRLSGGGTTSVRCHGDYHLGQVLQRNDGAWIVLDFEGEVARPLAERRERHTALRDVAGMLRSFSYAAAAVLQERRDTLPAEQLAVLRAWLGAWESEVRAAFLDGYRTGAGDGSFLPADDATFEAALAVFELEKALYELGYELNNRPDWIWIPVQGIRELMNRDVRE